MTYRDLWSKIDVSYSTGAGWKQKHRFPPVDVCVGMADQLGITVNYLVTGIELGLYDDTTIRNAVLLGEDKSPRSIPSDVLHALTYCSADDFQKVKKLLGLGH